MLGFLDATRQLVFDGAVNGLIYGVLAMAIILVYRSSRVINFAAGNMGLPGAGIVALLHLRYDVPLGIAIAAGLTVGMTFGVIIELSIVRRLFTAPRVILMVATIGVAQLAQGVVIAIPEIPGGVGVRYPTATTAGIDSVAGVHVTPSQLVVVIAAPIIAILLGLVVDRTHFGRTVAATAANGPLSRLHGINPKSVSTRVWLVAGLISTAAIILISANQSVTGLETVGPLTMSNALAAAVIARMRSFPLALVGGTVVGIGFSLAKFNYPLEAGLFEFALFVVVVAAVAIQSRDSSADSGRFSFAPRVTAIPAHLREIFWVRNLNRIGLGLLLLALAILPLIVTTNSRQLAYTTILAFAICAASVTVITGWSGQLSLAQMTFGGIGALTAAAFTRGMSVDIGWGSQRFIDGSLAPLPFALAIVLGAVIAGAVAAVIGLGALRVRGLLLAVSTFIFAIAAQLYLFRRPFFSGGNSSDVPFRRGTLFGIDLDVQRSYFWFVLLFLCLVVTALAQVRQGPLGRAAIALRDNRDAARSYGIRPTATLLRSFALAGFVAGLGGGLLAGVIDSVPINGRFFGVEQSMRVVAIAIIGGVGTVVGPILGALWVVGLPAFSPQNQLVPLFSSSIGLLALLLYFPGGFAALVYRSRDQFLAWLATRRPAPDTTSSTVLPTALSRPVRPSATMDEDALAVAGITVNFGGIRAVNDVSLRVGAGEVVGLIGTNGAGKSSLMNAIGGFVPAAGTVALYGQSVERSSAEKRSGAGLGRTFQAATLFPELTVRESVLVAREGRHHRSAALAALPIGPGRRAGRADAGLVGDLIDFLGLGRYADARIADLSTGTRRIVELAGILALDATMLCLDEPTAGVAQKEGEAFGPLMLEIRRELGAAMLIIEHDVPLVMSMSDRVYCLETGRVIAEGAPDEIRNDPLVIASYLGGDLRAIERSDANHQVE
jgi:ABC-type branched-subunit amino acid transport system ATPase component/ABC-type branched-subunit amino acid transport system permease subunit